MQTKWNQKYIFYYSHVFYSNGIILIIHQDPHVWLLTLCIQATFSTKTTCYLTICNLRNNAYKPWKQPPWPKNLVMKLQPQLTYLLKLHVVLDLLVCKKFSILMLFILFKVDTYINSRHGKGHFWIMEVISLENTLSIFPYQSCCTLLYLNH